jgi:hypothetical protein
MQPEYEVDVDFLSDEEPSFAAANAGSHSDLDQACEKLPRTHKHLR